MDIQQIWLVLLFIIVCCLFLCYFLNNIYIILYLLPNLGPIIISATPSDTRGGVIVLTGNNFGNQMSEVELLGCTLVSVSHQNVNCSVGAGI